MKYFNLIQFKDFGFPLIKITKSLDGSTGTASFLFKIEKNIKIFYNDRTPFYKIFFNKDGDLLISNRVNIFFANGKPIFLLFIFVFKNQKDWNLFDFFIKKYLLKNNLKFYNL